MIHLNEDMLAGAKDYWDVWNGAGLGGGDSMLEDGNGYGDGHHADGGAFVSNGFGDGLEGMFGDGSSA